MHRDSIKLGDISPRNIIHQKSAACTVIFDTLRAKASLIVACNRRLAFVGETRFMLNKHEANRLWRFYKKSPLAGYGAEPHRASLTAACSRRPAFAGETH